MTAITLWKVGYVVLGTIAWYLVRKSEKENERILDRNVELFGELDNTKSELSECRVRLSGEIETLEKENAALKRQLAKRKGDDTKRANRFYSARVEKNIEGYQAMAFYGNQPELYVGACRHTRKQAISDFESVIGLRGKIKWAADV